MSSNIGLIGLGTMGTALARNIASRGVKVSLWNRTQEKISRFVGKYGAEYEEGAFYAPKNFEDFLEEIESPKRIILMLPPGEATQDMISKLLPALRKGDAIMDGGNAIFRVTEVFAEKLKKKGIHFLGCGISGGEEGALHGPSIMPGGSEQAWEIFEPILGKIAAEDFDGGVCVAYMGKGGAGHYVKMVHNGIEYAEIQMLAEAYDLLKTLYKLKNEEIAEIFKKWDEGRLGSFLTEISVDVLLKKEGKVPLLDLILDEAGQKGTGTWTSQEALALGVASPSITGAVFMRSLSQTKEDRSILEKEYPILEITPDITASEFTEHLEKALFASHIANFEQGLALLRAADAEYSYGLNLPEILRIWQGGCIIRSKVLKEMREAVQQKNDSLYFSDFAHKALVEAQKSWKLVVETATKHSIPMAAISGSLMHFEASRHKRLPANFIQGLRDHFGSHGIEKLQTPER